MSRLTDSEVKTALDNNKERLYQLFEMQQAGQPWIKDVIRTEEAILATQKMILMYEEIIHLRKTIAALMKAQ